MPSTTTRAAIAAAATLALTIPTTAEAAPTPQGVPDVQPANLPRSPAVGLNALRVPVSPDTMVRAALVARAARTGMGRPATRTAVRPSPRPRTPEHATAHRSVTHRQAGKHRSHAGRHRASSSSAPLPRHGLAAVLAFARSQIGDGYAHGADGGGVWDCSGLTRAAYAVIGVHLPHSSGAQRARGRYVSRAEARPGDLVVGPGHVGIYAGNGRVVDAGNPRTGVSERPMWPGLQIMRLA